MRFGDFLNELSKFSLCFFSVKHLSDITLFAYLTLFYKIHTKVNRNRILLDFGFQWFFESVCCKPPDAVHSLDPAALNLWPLGSEGGGVGCSEERVHKIPWCQNKEPHYVTAPGSSQEITHVSVLKAFLIAIVVPDVDTLSHWAQKRGFEGSFDELCRNKVRFWCVWSLLFLHFVLNVLWFAETSNRGSILFLLPYQDLKKVILEDMVRIGKEAGLKSFEQVRLSQRAWVLKRWIFWLEDV